MMKDPSVSPLHKVELRLPLLHSPFAVMVMDGDTMSGLSSLTHMMRGIAGSTEEPRASTTST